MYTINRIADLVEYLYDFKEKNKNRDSGIYYRGESKNYGLSSGTPSIGRNNKLKNEYYYFRECERRLPNEFRECRTTFERLVKMQHYMMPTRLLDISLDPLSALFFCIYDDPRSKIDTSEEDGILLIYKIPKETIKNHHSDAVSIISNIAVYKFDDLDISFLNPDYENDRKAFNNAPSIKYLLHEIRAEKSYFQPWIDKKDLESVFCVHPLLDNPRIRMQQGAFLLFGIDGNRNKLASIDKSKIICEKLLIPSKAKQRLRDELLMMGKTIDVIYPDWDGVTDYLNRFCEI
ncbi:MAG: FRG domain protein [bacterium ADurb.Bin157]|nr:MAG: FRG domain protein [bacterium ADurb.Bin157]